MKKLIWLCILFLTCCAPAATPRHMGPTVPVIKTHPNVDAFKTTEECPHICWLGIHPGKTTRQDAIDIFTKSPGNANMRLTPATLEGEWYADNEKILKCFVAIHFSNDVVDTIMLGRLEPFTTADFVKLLGEPEKVWILWTDDRVGYGFRRTQYALYYPEQKIEVQSGYSGTEESDWGGPRPDATIEWLRVGVSPQHEEQYLQLWLGYGHLEDYRLKAVPTPGS